MTQPEARPTIPFLDLDASRPVALLDSHGVAATELIRAGRQMLPGPLLPTMDRLSRRWARRSGNPHYDEIESIAQRLPTGIWFMNLCFEWGCTTGVAQDPAGPGMRMLRTLDWPFKGLGRHVVLARQSGPAGDFINITWPGFVGVVTGMAPGRFALAINQAPLVRRGYLPLFADWIANRFRVFRSAHLPPVHLARHVLETCATYDEAREVLESAPLALPAFFVLTGTGTDEGCVIERTETNAWLHEAPASAANHWLTRSLRGRPRGIDSPRRHRMMSGLCRNAQAEFDWLIDPVLNPDTRLSVVANPASGHLLVQGWESDGPATEVFRLAAAD